MKKLLGLVVLLSAFVAVYLVATPSPIEPPQAWQSQPAPAKQGVLEANDSLMKAELLAQGQITGPEDTAIDSHGRLYAGLDDGRIVRIHNGQLETFVNTGGRPLGMDFDAHGNLIVADAYKGLLRISADKHVEVLANEADGVPFAFTDDVDIARDGRIYFSDASHRFSQPDYLLDLLEGRPYGRLLRYDPATKQTEVLLDNLYFANGVALSKEQDFVLVNETYRYRIQRYWLSGDKAGSAEVFAENLPGLPDNLQGDGQGTFWVALPTPRKADLDFLQNQPWLKQQMAKLPRAFWPKATRYGLVIALNEQGEIIRSLHDSSGSHLHMITSAKPVGDYLYLGSLENDRIGKLHLD